MIFPSNITPRSPSTKQPANTRQYKVVALRELCLLLQPVTQVTGRNIRVLLTEVEPITFWLLAQMPYLSKAIKLGSRLFRRV